MQRRSPRDIRLRQLRDSVPASWRSIVDVYLHVCRKLHDECAVGVDLVWTRIDPIAGPPLKPGMQHIGESIRTRHVDYACVHLARYEVCEVTLYPPSEATWALVATVNVPADGALAARLEHGFTRTVLLKHVQSSCSLFIARPYSFGCDWDSASHTGLLGVQKAERDLE